MFFKIPTGVKVKRAALKKSDKIKYIPFATARPTLSECDSVCRRLGRLRFVHSVLKVEQTANLKINSTPTNQNVEKKIKEASDVLEERQSVVAAPSISEGQILFRDAIARNDTQSVKKILKNS